MTLEENLQRLREEVNHKNSTSDGGVIQLSPQLESIREAVFRNLPQNQLKMLEQIFTELSIMDIEENCIKIGNRVHDFALPDINGTTVHLRHVLEKGPAVISFFFGNWCPYCRLQLEVWQKYQSTIDALDVTNIAISPQMSQQNRQITKRFNLTYDVLSDSDNQVANLFGIAFRIPQIQQNCLEHSGISLIANNGNDSMKLPANATFIVDQDRTVRYAFVDHNYTKRAEPMNIIDILIEMRINAKTESE